MAYSNDQRQIRNGLTNFLGALIKSSPYENDEAIKQNICAILNEEALKICQEKEGTINLYCAKPFIRGCIFILNQRINELNKIIALNSEVKYRINEYKKAVSILELLLKNIKE